MTRNFGNPAHVAGSLRSGSVAVPRESTDRSLRRGLRGIFALGALFVMAAASYTVVFVLIDKWYKGGSLGIL